ncbi:hypothetical protein [Fluviicola sp.]|uniref:hypothetical protein n=1 Tax=Fluviicola sp. TaxID=1917219 RepID=UPI0031E36112
MKRIPTSTLLVFLSLLALTSCKQVFLGLYGMRMPKEINEKRILKAGRKYHIPVEDSYVLHSAYSAYLFSLDTSKFKLQIKNHYQPLQAVYYNSNGIPESFQINCYAGGFPNLKWNRNDIFETFPPKQQAPVDSLLTLSKHLEFLRPLSGTAEKNPGKTDYFAIVHWNRFMGRQTKRLIRCVQKNARRTTGQQLKIIYANNDNLFLKAF